MAPLGKFRAPKSVFLPSQSRVNDPVIGPWFSSDTVGGREIRSHHLKPWDAIVGWYSRWGVDSETSGAKWIAAILRSQSEQTPKPGTLWAQVFPQGFGFLPVAVVLEAPCKPIPEAIHLKWV